MGEAKRRAAMPVTTVYHHTSTLRTNLIWMSGIIDVEGRSEGVVHPLMGEVRTDVKLRRPCVDFPPLVWFTRDIHIPKVLRNADSPLGHHANGAQRWASEVMGDPEGYADGMALHRVALGFPLAASDIIPWPEHVGYSTTEGCELNRTAREAGDNPDRWYVADKPIDVLTASEIWTSATIFKPKLVSRPGYLSDIHNMVRLCRLGPETYIPPTWINDPTVNKMAQQAGITQAQIHEWLAKCHPIRKAGI